MTTFNKQETALFQLDGDFWLATDNGSDLDGKLADLIDIADHETPENLFGTTPEGEVVNIGSSPRRPRKP
jgi:hypothetical protein